MKAYHDTLRIERDFSASPETLYKAMTTLEGRLNWFYGPEGWVREEQTLDFRVGGKETMKGAFNGVVPTSYTATFYDIVEGERFITCFDVTLDNVLFSVSLATTEIQKTETGAKLIFTEQLTYVNAPDGKKAHEGRYFGTNMHFDRLEAYLSQ